MKVSDVCGPACPQVENKNQTNLGQAMGKTPSLYQVGSDKNYNNAQKGMNDGKTQMSWVGGKGS